MEPASRIIREGTPWPERIRRARDDARRSGTEHSAPTGTDGTDAADGDWSAWQQAVDPDDAGIFRRRLRWDGLQVSTARSMLLGAGDGGTSPSWLPELESLRAANGAAQSDLTDPALAGLPFDRLLSPIVADAWNRFTRRADPEWLAPLSPVARFALRHDLGRRISDVTAPAWYADFAESRTVGANLLLRLGMGTDRPPGGDEAFRTWCREQAEDGLERLLQRFGVLGRLMATASEQWRRATAELVERIHRHRPQLATVFGIPADAVVRDIVPGLSDHHRGGQSVSIIEFGSDDVVRRLVYKPRDLRMEAELRRLIRLVNEWFADRRLVEIEVVAGDGEYGFTSFVEHRACEADELPDFYIAAGRMLGLLYLLGATDAHYENLIAAGPSLALLDPETLFHSDVAGFDDGPGNDEAGSGFADTVLRTGMLPGWHLAGPDQSVYDPSALGIESGFDSVSTSGWANLNSDDMVWAGSSSPPNAPRSLPVGAAARNPLASHVDDLVDGFRDVHAACREEPFRSQLLELLEGFRGLPRRVVLRATRVYALVQRRALSADAVSSANRRGVELELLARSSLVGGKRDPFWAVFHAELHDMENLDIPYFQHRLGSRDVHGSLGPIGGLVTGDGIQDASERISTVDDDDLAWQIRLIRGAVRARYLVADRAHTRTRPSLMAPPAIESTDVPADAADHISTELLAQIESSAASGSASGRDTWLTLSLLPDGRHTRLGTVSDGWYDGRSGIAAVQQLGAELGRGESLGRQASATVAPVVEVLQHPDPYVRFRYLRNLGMGFNGVGGILRLLRLPSRDEGVAEFRRSILDRLVTQVPVDVVGRDRVHDLVGGVAGLIQPLAQIVRERRDLAVVRLLTAAAEHLQAVQSADGGWPSPIAERPLTGLAHGAAGCGLALLEAGAARERGDWIEAGARAFRYEADVYDAAAGNWPDFRGHRTPGLGAAARQPMTAWCHGAAGIGLTRMRALQLLPAHPDAGTWRQELESAMRTTATAPDAGTDHLCCGLMGRAAVLRIVGRSLGRQEWLAASDSLTGVAVARFRRSGRFVLPLDDPASSETVSPGLMTGLAGIAAQLMTCSHGQDLRAFLL